MVTSYLMQNKKTHKPIATVSNCALTFTTYVRMDRLERKKEKKEARAGKIA